MRYKLNAEGFDKVGSMLKELGEQAGRIASEGLYEGAGVMADEIKSGAGEIKTAPFHYAVFIQRDPSPEEKAIVENARMGIARFRKDGGDVTTSVGYANAGYDMLAGKRKPIPKIVNAINSGTSFMKKQPFVRKAASRGAPKADAAIVGKIEEEYEKIIKKNGG